MSEEVMSDEPFRGQPDAVEIIAKAICIAAGAPPSDFHLFAEDGQSVIAALNAAGLVIVPKERTGAMADAYYDLFRIAPGTETWNISGNPDSETVWNTMLQTLAADGSSKNLTEDRE